ncbi:beta-lactamase family protein [Bacillus shivajii]|uniref:serine hydrolase domain-containing protein n=1 Tax=Bacillus shivajii TaxID=1983719 RepID=UPI001CFA3F2F|nr:serine hydrolase domain-containing protein [Bacillus shivajii]UCZ54918.1 beta-lactamase family protein [Bacillus shivajii]
MHDRLHKVDEIIGNFVNDQKFPGLSLHIVSDGDSIFTFDYGYSNIELKKPMQQDTVSSIMSISKSITALAMLHLEENSDFNLDTPIIEYLPYFKTMSGRYNKITSKHILSHTAGFPDNIWLVTLLDYGLYEFAKKLPEYQFIYKQFPNLEETLTNLKSREDITKYFSNSDLTYEPGQGWLYCTDSYVILADILEKISGLTWEEYVTENIIKPLNMDNTYINPSTSLQTMNNYYLYRQSDYIKLPTPNNSLGAPVGFIYSTANDMAKYLIAIMGTEQKVISQSSRSKMFSRIAQREPGLSYGLGWKVKKVRESKVIEHAGGYPGVSSFASMIPAKQFGLVILCNTSDVPLQILSDKIIDIFNH